MNQLNNTPLNYGKNEIPRQCGMCKKMYKFSEIKKSYPIFCHNELKNVWKNPEIEFYCSYCYLLKLIRFTKAFKLRKRSNNLDNKNNVLAN